MAARHVTKATAIVYLVVLVFMVAILPRVRDMFFSSASSKFLRSVADAKIKRDKSYAAILALAR